MDIDLRVIQQNQKSGLRQTDPRAFTAGAQGLIQLGQGLQDVGDAGAKFASQQAAIANDNLVNKSLLDFEKEKISLLTQVQTDAAFREKTPTAQFGSYVGKKLEAKQRELLSKLPATRKNSFLAATGKNILQSQLTATGEGVKLNNSNYKANAINLRRSVMDSIANPQAGFDLDTAKNNYLSFIRNGTRAGVYDPDEAANLYESFKDEAALTQLDREELVLINGEEVTTESIDQHLENINKSPLDPKDKAPRTESFLTSLATRSRRRAAELKALQEQVENDAFSDYYMRVPNPDLAVQADDVLTLQEVKAAIDLGIIRTPARIKDLQQILQAQEKLDHYPDGFDINDKTTNQWENIKGIVLDASVFREDAAALIDAFAGQVNEMQELAPFDLTTKESNALLEKISTFKSKMFDDKFRAEEKRIESAKNKLRFLIKGDPLDERFKLVSPRVVSDAQNTAEMLIRSGVNPALAIDEAMEMLDVNLNKFAQGFKAEKAQTTIIEKFKKSPRSISDDERELLRRMVERRGPDSKAGGANKPGERSKEQLLEDAEKEANR